MPGLKSHNALLDKPADVLPSLQSIACYDFKYIKKNDDDNNVSSFYPSTSL